MSGKEKRIVQAAGGIVYRWKAESDYGADPMSAIELCVVHRPKYDDWSWPKGKLENNESFRHAAVREIGEETGKSVQLGPYLMEVEYPLNAEGKKSRRKSDPAEPVKQVKYWMATVVNRNDARHLTDPFGPVHRADIGEIDHVEWLPITQARKRLTHATDRDVLAAFVDRLEEGAGRAQTLLLVRHAKAESRKSWDGTDENRPITPKGAAHAYALDRELACFNPVRLITSPWLRCQQTVQMLAWQTQRPMEYLESMTEDAFADNSERTWHDFRTLLDATAQGEQTALICMHRPVIGGMFAKMQSMCSSSTLEKMLKRKSPYMPAGTALAISVVQDAGTTKIIDIQKVQPIVY